MDYAEIMERSRQTQVVDLPLGEIEVSTQDGTVVADIGGTEVPVEGDTLEVVAKSLDLPFKLMRTLSPQTQVVVFEDRISDNAATNLNFGVNPELQTVEFFGPQTKPVVQTHLVGEVLENRGFEMTAEAGRFGSTVLTATHPFEGRVEPRVDDITRAGIRYEGNPAMDTNPFVTPWSERLACTNGMTLTEDRPLFNIVGHSVEDVLRQIEEAAEREFQRAEQINSRFADLNSHPVNNLVTAVFSLAAANRTPAWLRKAMTDRAEEMSILPPSGGFTMYDAMNIFTYFATHRSSDSRSRFSNQSIAGGMLYNETLVCSHCRQTVDPTR
jgi:hypothetical protein